MNKEAQRIAIAKACGWKEVRPPLLHEQADMQHMFPCAHMPWLTGIHKTDHVWRHPVPGYPLCLSAMHEAEKLITTMGELLEFSFYLRCLVQGKCIEPNGYVPGFYRDDSTQHWFDCVHATAAQRAEAFLRTKNLWQPQ